VHGASIGGGGGGTGPSTPRTPVPSFAGGQDPTFLLRRHVDMEQFHARQQLALAEQVRGCCHRQSILRATDSQSSAPLS
jgi:hypothetical protein